MFRNDVSKVIEWEFAALIPSQKHWFEQSSIYKIPLQKLRSPGKRLQHRVGGGGGNTEIRKHSLKMVGRTVSHYLHHPSPKPARYRKHGEKGWEIPSAKGKENEMSTDFALDPTSRPALVNPGAWMIPVDPGTRHIPVPHWLLWPQAAGWHPQAQPPG